MISGDLDIYGNRGILSEEIDKEGDPVTYDEC